MNLFLKKTFLFIAISFATTILLFLSLNYIINKTFNGYKINSNIESIFEGDSHIQMAVDGKFLPHAVNLSQNSESFYFSYFKIKTILKTNPSIKKIYLGFSYHNLSSYYEDYIYGIYSKDISARYFFILPFEEKMKFIRYNYNELPEYFGLILSDGFKNVASKNKLVLGQYENRFKKNSADKKLMDNRLKFQFCKDGRLRGFSEFNISYLNNIIDLCESEKVDLIMLNTPLHSYYRNKLPVEYVRKYDEILKQKRLKIMDLSTFKLDDDCYVPDGDHVSVKGAEKLSKAIDILINAKKKSPDGNQINQP